MLSRHDRGEYEPDDASHAVLPRVHHLPTHFLRFPVDFHSMTMRLSVRNPQQDLPYDVQGMLLLLLLLLLLD